MSTDVVEIRLKECGSTNDEAAVLAREGAPSGSFVVADRQTAGRGRRGRRWVSPYGGLYVSVVTRPAVSPGERHRVALSSGVAVAELLAAYGAQCVLKWPNDVLIHGKKIAGVLTEVVGDAVIVGVGINVLDVVLPGRGIALEHVVRAAPHPDGLARTTAYLVDAWSKKCAGDAFQDVLRRWRSYMYEGLLVSIASSSGSVEGAQHDLGDDGSLVLRSSRGELVRVTCGDVEVVAGD